MGVALREAGTGVCAYCRGRGTDPFGILSWISSCHVCHGEGVVPVPVPHVACRYCRGTGSHKVFRCHVCGGAGVVAAPTPAQRRCVACGGRAYEISSGLECLECKGRGTMSIAA